MANLENAQASSAVALRLNPLKPDVFIHQPVGVSLSSNGKPFERAGAIVRFSFSMTSGSSAHPSPRVVCQLHLYYGILIYFRFSMWVKVSQGNRLEGFCANSPRSFPSIQENLRPFSLTSPLNFMRFHAPPDKVQSCFAVKETAFQFGCSNFPAGRTRSYTCMDWSLAISIALNHSKRLREHGVCHKPAISLIFPLPNCGAESTICTSHPCRL
jgi:hypothetical protein